MKITNLTFIIEDDEITAFLIPKVLEQSGAFQQTRIFENGQPALAYLKKALKQNQPLPDLILLDINMPVMDGWDFLNEINQSHMLKNIPVVMLTSSIHEADIQKSKSYQNVIGYITKPLEPEKVQDIIKLVRKHSLA